MHFLILGNSLFLTVRKTCSLRISHNAYHGENILKMFAYESLSVRNKLNSNMHLSELESSFVHMFTDHLQNFNLKEDTASCSGNKIGEAVRSLTGL